MRRYRLLLMKIEDAEDAFGHSHFALVGGDLPISI